MVVSNVIPAGKPVAAFSKHKSKYKPNDFEITLLASKSRINFHSRNVGRPIIALTLIPKPRPNER